MDLERKEFVVWNGAGALCGSGMEDDNLLAKVKKSVIRIERSLWSGKRMTETSFDYLSLTYKELY